MVRKLWWLGAIVLFAVVGAALGAAAAAPFIGEQQLGAVVVERRRVPVGEIRVRDREQAPRMRRVADVEQQAVPRAGAARQADRRGMPGPGGGVG